MVICILQSHAYNYKKQIRSKIFIQVVRHSPYTFPSYIFILIPIWDGKLQNRWTQTYELFHHCMQTLKIKFWMLELTITKKYLRQSRLKLNGLLIPLLSKAKLRFYSYFLHFSLRIGWLEGGGWQRRRGGMIRRMTRVWDGVD